MTTESVIPSIQPEVVPPEGCFLKYCASRGGWCFIEIPEPGRKSKNMKTNKALYYNAIRLLVELLELPNASPRTGLAYLSHLVTTLEQLGRIPVGAVQGGTEELRQELERYRCLAHEEPSNNR